jgi:predicted O-methyltransferase YrrM
MTRFYDQGWDKLIVRADAFAGMRQWCHHAAVSYGGTLVVEDLGLLHFHETGFRRQIERSLTVMRTFGPSGYVDTSAPLGDQLKQTTAICAAGVSCGHKVAYYDTYLRRKICVESFVKYAGRLPSDAEMAKFCDPTVVDPEREIRGLCVLLGAGNGEGSAGRTKDSLVYADVKKEAAFEVRSVADFLAGTGAPPVSPSPSLSTWATGDGAKEKLSCILGRHAADHNERGTDKTTSHAYGDLYDAVFEPHRTTAKHVLEIGVYSGASVLSFAEFFDVAVIDGIDITLANVRFGKENPRIMYHLIDGTSPDAPLMLGHKYDVILDDASHLAEHQVRSLEIFADHLSAGGVYVIEDIAVSRFPGVEAALRAVAAAKGLSVEWHDLRAIKGQHDDVVAVFRKSVR